MAFGVRGVATLTFYHPTKWKQDVKFKPPLALPQEGTLAPIVKEVPWAPKAALIFWRRKETVSLTGTRFLDLPSRNVVAIPNPLFYMEILIKNWKTI